MSDVVKHEHKPATRRDVNNVFAHGYDRIVEICTCGAARVLVREVGEPRPTATEWR